jgi:hypothetical protein
MNKEKITRKEALKRIGGFAALGAGALLGLTSCGDLLKPKTYSTLGPSNFYKSATDADALIRGIYAMVTRRDMERDLLTFSDMPSGVMFEQGGSINSFIGPTQNFEWNASNVRLEVLWQQYYAGIYRANLVLDKVPGIDMDQDQKTEILAEAQYMRAFFYYYLHDLFGPVPIIKTSKTSASARPKRPDDTTFDNFIIGDFKASSANLPEKPVQYGRATRGAATGFLCKYYLRKKQWSKAAAAAKQVIDSGTYALVTGPRTKLFAPDNQVNSEFMFVNEYPNGSQLTNAFGNTYLSHALPPEFKFTKFPAIIDFEAQIKMRSKFLKLFEKDDQRRAAFLFEYTNTNNELVHLGHDDVRSFKYPLDPAETGSVTSIDSPLLRYADMLLSRAEALNEQNGPSQEAVNLVNQIRSAAGVSDITIAEYPSKKALRNFILDERAREFHTEFKRRQDLLRHGLFIKNAQERGLPAKDFQVLYPIPQQEIDRNENLEQNSGYG